MHIKASGVKVDSFTELLHLGSLTFISGVDELLGKGIVLCGVGIVVFFVVDFEDLRV